MKKVALKRNNINRTNGSSKGFTIAELLIVIAILLVLVALGIIAGVTIVRNMRQSHLDKRAEAVYYAAESRMMELFVTQDKTSIEDSEDGKEVDKAVVDALFSARRFTNEDGTFAYITSDESSAAKELFTADRTLAAELEGTSWIIEYDPVSLDIYAVILSEHLEKSGTDLASLTGTSVSAPVRGTPQTRNQAYNAYVGYYSEGANGGAGASAKSGLAAGCWILNRRDLLGVIKITCDEKTRRAISNISFKVTLSGDKSEGKVEISSNKIYWQNYAQDTDDSFLENGGESGIVITTSDVRNSIPVSCFGNATDNRGKYALIGYVKLDSLDKNLQFKDIEVTDAGGTLGDNITPGEDITMSVKVWDSGDGNAEYSENVRGATAISTPENSLYADFDVKGGQSVATIIYPRHLQNLDYDFSNVEAEAAAEGTAGEIAAILLEDIEWDEEENLYKDDIRNFTPICNDQLVSFNGLKFEDPETATPLGKGDSITAENPELVNGEADDEENKYHSITGLRIDTSDTIIGSNRNVGLFGNQPHLTVANLVLSRFDINSTVSGQGTGMLAGKLEDSTVKNIYVYNTPGDAVTCGIKGAGSCGGVIGEMAGTTVEGVAVKNLCVESTGNAGAFAGKVSGGSDIKNVLAYNGELGSQGASGQAVQGTVGFDDSGFSIKGGTNAGGLIGDMDGGSLTGCTAALYVRASSGNAGGLLGRAGSGASIDMCQAGGHTTTDESGQAGKYDKSTGQGKGSVNVVGSSAAGGFVGQSAGAGINNSYSTCSASAGTVGGFAGSAQGGSISNCYGVGQVFFQSAGSAGGFIGSGSASLSSNHYFEIINPTGDGKYLKGIGGTEKDVTDAVRAIDDEILEAASGSEYEYNKFVIAGTELAGDSIGRGEKTHRYQAELKPDSYVLKFASQLAASTATELFYADSHYGDWPICEDIIVNEGVSVAKNIWRMNDPYKTLKAMAGNQTEAELVRALAEDVITEPISDENASDSDSSTADSTEENAENSGDDSSKEEAKDENASDADNQAGADEGSSSSNEDSSSEEEKSEDSQEAEDNAESDENGGADEGAGTDENSEPSENVDNEQQNAENNSDSDAANTDDAKESENKDDENEIKIDEETDKKNLDLAELVLVEEEEEEEPAEGTIYNDEKGISITFGKEAEIPEGAELVVNDIAKDSEDYDYPQLVSDAAEAMEIETEDVASFKAMDIAIVKDGEEIQPKAPVSVEIRTEQLYENKELFVDDVVAAVHMKEDEPEVIETTVSNEEIEEGRDSDNPASNDPADAITFDTDGFSVYVLVQPIQQKKVIATDDSVYVITVDYDNASGIPADAELVVSETTSDSDEYAGIVEESAKELETYSEFIKAARVFDISFVNSETGDTYQPTKDVKVSVELMQDEVGAEDEEIKVVHFGETNEVLENEINEGLIEFTTGGFSTFTIIKLPTFDVVDTTLDGETYYISYEDTTTDPATKRYLYIDVTSPTTFGYTDDASKATPWKFELVENGYTISNGTNYISHSVDPLDPTDSEKWVWQLDTEANANEFTSANWGDYHLLCLAKSSDTNKYLGYGTSANHLDTLPKGSAAQLHLTVTQSSTEIEDKSFHGRSFYILESGYFLSYTKGSASTTEMVPSKATEWTLVLDDHGYKIHNGQTYVGIENGKVVFTKAAKAAEFKVVDLGDYHLLEYYDANAAIPGYYGQYLNVGRPKDSQFAIAATDRYDPAEEFKVLLVNDISIEGNFAMYLTKGSDKLAMADTKVTVSGRGDMLRADNIKSIVNELTGEIVENFVVNPPVVINTIWNFEKGANKFEHYIKVAAGTQVGKYVNMVWDGGKSHLRLSDTKQAFTISILPNGQIRIMGGSTTAPLAIDYSNGGRNFQAYEFSKGSDGNNANEWFNIAEMDTLRHYTINYIYPKEKGDVGTKNNRPASTTEFVSGDATDTTGQLKNYVLKNPAATKYYSYDDNYKYTYEFVGWKIRSLTGTHEQGTFLPGETIDLTSLGGLSTVNIKAIWKLVNKEEISYKVTYQMIDAEPGYGNGIIGDKLPDIVDLDYDASTPYFATEDVTKDAIKQFAVRNIGYKDENGKYWISYQEKQDPKGYFPNRNVRSYQRIKGTGDERFYHTYLFMGWETETGAVLSAYDLDHKKVDLSKYDENLDGTIELKSAWSHQWAETGNSNPSVNLSVLRNADQIDNPNNPNQFLTEDRAMYIHIDGATMYHLDENGYPVAHDECRAPSKRPYKYFIQYIIDETTVTRTEKDIVRADKAIRKKLAGDGLADSGVIDKTVHDKYQSQSSIGPASDNVDKGHTWQISYLPSDERVFDYLRKKSTKDIFIYNEITGASEKISKSELTPDKYMIRWVVAKYQSADSEVGWHVNAKITKKISCVTVTKTFKGNPDKISKLMEGIEQIKDTDSDAEKARKVEIAKKKFNITLKNTANPNEVLYLTLLNRVTNNVAISKTGMAKVADDAFGYVDYKEKTDSSGNIVGTYTWLITFDDEKTFEIKENNYDDRDPLTGVSTFGTELTYNQTNTGASDDGVEKAWDPEIPVKTTAEPTDNTDYEDNATTNLTNNIKMVFPFHIKKINDKKEGIKDVKFRVYLKGSDDPIRLYYRNNGDEPDGNYNVLYENNKSDFYALTNDKGFLNLFLAWPENDPIVYTIQEEIPDGYQGHDKYAPKFEVEVTKDGIITITKSKVDMPPSYGMVEPYEITYNGTEEVWTKKPYEKVGEEQIAVCNGAVVINSSGIEVALKKITGKTDDNNKAERLAGAQFTFYDATKDGDNNSLASVIDGSAKEYQNVILKNGDDEEVATVVTSTDSTDDKGNLVFKIPSGMYYMKETAVPDKYEPDYYVEKGKDPDDEKNHLQYIYRLYVGEEYVKQAVDDVQKDTGKTLEIVEEEGEKQTKFVIVRMDKATEKIDKECIQDNKSVVGEVGIIDLLKDRGKVLLKKVNGDNIPLAGPKFDIYRSDGLRILNGDDESWTAGAAGAIYIGKLSEGTYYLHETAGGGTGANRWFRVKVEKDSEGNMRAGKIETISGSPFTKN